MANPENLFIPSQPVTDKKARTRAQILHAALACFSNKGYHQTSMDDIVAESGLSKGALYWHFKSKQELFVSLIEWYMSAFGEEASHAWTDDMSATDKIRAMMMFFVDSSEQLIPFFKITIDFWAQTSEDEQLRAIFDEMLDNFQQQLRTIIEEGITNGEFRPVDTFQLGGGAVGGGHRRAETGGSYHRMRHTPKEKTEESQSQALDSCQIVLRRADDVA
jgi:AcrR family transcriptional regulator